MGIMVAARFKAGFEFFAHPRQKSLGSGAHATYLRYKANVHKKARPDFSGAGCKVQGKP
jgi:hypothetical protein